MYARVTTFETRGEDDVRDLEQTAIPTARRLRGFKGGYWLLDRTTGEGLAVTFWESMDAMAASEDEARRLREQQGGRMNVRHYEVVASA